MNWCWVPLYCYCVATSFSTDLIHETCMDLFDLSRCSQYQGIATSSKIWKKPISNVAIRLLVNVSSRRFCRPAKASAERFFKFVPINNRLFKFFKCSKALGLMYRRSLFCKSRRTVCLGIYHAVSLWDSCFYSGHLRVYFVCTKYICISVGMPQ